MNLTELGRLLEEWRKAVGMSKAEVARRVGVTPGYIWMIEKGKPRRDDKRSQPSVEVLQRWAKALGRKPKEDDPYIRQLLALAGHLPAEATTVPAPDFGMGLDYPEPRSLERERLIQELRQLVEKAEGSAETTWQGTVELTEVLLEGMRQMLDAGEKPQEKWDETIRLVRSHLQWLCWSFAGGSDK